MPDYHELDRMIDREELLRRGAKAGIVDIDHAKVVYRGFRLGRSVTDAARRLARRDLQELAQALNTEVGDATDG